MWDYASSGFSARHRHSLLLLAWAFLVKWTRQLFRVRRKWRKPLSFYKIRKSRPDPSLDISSEQKMVWRFNQPRFTTLQYPNGLGKLLGTELNRLSPVIQADGANSNISLEAHLEEKAGRSKGHTLTEWVFQRTDGETIYCRHWPFYRLLFDNKTRRHYYLARTWRTLYVTTISHSLTKFKFGETR